MKVVILAGGLGTRLQEETETRPKPMVEIGDEPILWHIMQIYRTQGYKEFIICGGYKWQVIEKWLDKFFIPTGIEIKLFDTGETTMTGGRIKRIQKYTNNKPFFLTYGDGLANINLDELLDCHNKAGKILTVTAAHPNGRFGGMKIGKDGLVRKFEEKPKTWINGGFFVCEPEIFNYIEGDQTTFEQEPIQQLVKEKQLNSYKHTKFWKCCDTLKDLKDLNKMWNENKAEWLEF